MASQFDSLGLEQVEPYAHELALGAGEAVAFDSRVLHWSSVNATSEATLAIGLILVPQGAALQRFAVDSDMRVHQYRVDRESFTKHLTWGGSEDSDLGPIVFDPAAITAEDLAALFPPPPVSPARRVLRATLLRVPPGWASRVPVPVKRLVRGVAARLT